MTAYKCDQIISHTGITQGYLIVDEGKVLGIFDDSQGHEVIDYTGYRLIPGIFDTHNHGTMGYSLYGNIEQPHDEVRGYLKGLAAQGVTSIFPTTQLEYFKAVVDVAREPIQGAQIVGIHSEGPYLNRVGENGVAEEPLVIDLDYIQSMIDQGQGLLKLVAIAPELPKSQAAIDLLRANDIHVAYAHSNMNYEEAYEAFSRGVSVATHTANVMSGIHHRHMGGLGACLLHPQVQCELIADGVHVQPEMMELMLRVKPLNQWMLISDSTSASGAPAGMYRFGEFKVIMNEAGFVKTETGRLMGSSKPVVYGMKVLHEQLHLTLSDLVAMSSYNVAQYYGLSDKGELSQGKDADFVILDRQFNVHYTYVQGQCVYHPQQEDCFNKAYIEKNRIN